MALSGVHLLIEGRVQGVGFRYFVMEKALALGLTGWVRNTPDGRVETTASGPRPALDKLLKAVEHGPALAQVSRVSAEWRAADPSFKTFDVR